MTDDYNESIERRNKRCIKPGDQEEWRQQIKSLLGIHKELGLNQSGLENYFLHLGGELKT